MRNRTQNRRKSGRLISGLPHLDAATLFLFVAGLFTFVEIEFGGKLFASEALLALYLILALANGANPFKDRYQKTILTFASLWLVSQIITDLTQETAMQDALKGMAKIVFLMISFAAISLLAKRKPFSLVAYLFGMAAGQFLRYLYNPHEHAGDDPWKWGLSFPIAFLLVALASVAFQKGRNFFAVLLALAGLTANVYYNFRSLAIIFFIVLAGLIYRLILPRTALKRKTAWLLVPAFAALLSFFQLGYGYAVTQGWLGYDAFRKHEEQSQGDLGLLIGGRSESLASFQAIEDSPILGHGSNPKDPRYMNIMIEEYLNHGYGREFQYYGDAIPSHSYILGSWVEGGALGGIFWLVVLAYTVRAVIITMRTPHDLLPLRLFAAAWLAWNIPFSPYSFTERLTSPFLMAVVILTISQTDRKRVNNQVHSKIMTVSDRPLAENVPAFRRFRDVAR